MSSEHIKKFETIEGWIWSISDADFRDGIEGLGQFIKDHGHARVPARYKLKDGFF